MIPQMTAIADFKQRWRQKGKMWDLHCERWLVVLRFTATK